MMTQILKRYCENVDERSTSISIVYIALDKDKNRKINLIRGFNKKN